MKKLLLLAVAFIGFATAASAQTFDQGTQNLTATLGFGSGSTMPVAISYEYGVYQFAADHQLGVGGNAIIVNSLYVISAECNYHYVGVDKLDLYAGLRLGRCFFKGGNGSFNSIDVGANYYFDPAWAVNVEFGSELSATCIGITHKF